MVTPKIIKGKIFMFLLFFLYLSIYPVYRIKMPPGKLPPKPLLQK